MESRLNINRFIIYIIFILSIFGCNETQISKDTPFMVVVKLLSAEQKIDYNEAKKYIDVDKVYSKYPGSINPEKEWKELLLFNFNLGKDKKFSNTIDYYKYDIDELINGEQSVVSLKGKNVKNPRDIVYTLERIQDKWIVVSIDYIK